MKKCIVTVLAVLTLLSFAACSDSENEKPTAPIHITVSNISDVSDCCEDDENSQKDCCHEKAKESQIPDCCGG